MFANDLSSAVVYKVPARYQSQLGVGWFPAAIATSFAGQWDAIHTGAQATYGPSEAQTININNINTSV